MRPPGQLLATTLSIKLFNRITGNHSERCKVQHLEGYLSKKLKHLQRSYSKVPLLQLLHQYTHIGTFAQPEPELTPHTEGVKELPARISTMLKPKWSALVANISYLRSSCMHFFIYSFPSLVFG